MAGIYHNAELGVISMSSDGENRLTIADKNLGATQVYNDGDTLSEANSGKFFQWGNNYGFPFTGSVTTSSSQVNAQNYGPGNYYSSSTFRIRSSSPRGWDSSNNDNLWGGVTGTVEAMQGPCDNNYHIPNSYDINSLISIMQYFFGYGVSSGYITYLKIPMTGYRQGTVAGGNVTEQGIYTRYWTSISYSEDSSTARALWIATESQNPLISYSRNTKVEGFNIRPFANTPVIPDYTWTRLYGDEIPKPPKNYIKRFQNNGNYYYFGDAPVHITSITLNESSLTLNTIGETYQLTATVDNPDACDTHIYWSSSDSSIAVVSKTGLVTCVSPGDCTITASCDGITATCSVLYTQVTGVTLNKSIINLTEAGQTEQLIATVTPSTASHKEVTWSSSDTSIATVSDAGLVTCVSPGSCTITVTTVEGGYTASCSVIKYMYVNYLVVGGGGGGATYQYGGGGGGGAICIGNACFGTNQIDVVVGSGGGANANGTASYICNSDFNINASGGCGGSCTSGGNSGSGCSGKKCSLGISDAGGGGGACGATSSQNGGLGYNGMGGGGGGGWSTSRGRGCCGGGDGGPFSSSGIRGCNATGYGGGGGGGGYYNNSAGVGGNGYQGVVDICYLANGSCGFTSATGGDSCYTCNGYCVHRFTSNGTFTITG